MVDKLEQDLRSLEELLGKLEIEYDQFFSGLVRIPPWKTENIVKGLIRRHSSRAIHNSSLNFKYKGLVARYNSYCRFWERRTREIEEGRVAGRPIKSVRPSSGFRAGVTPRDKRLPADHTFVTRDPRQEPEKVSRIFEDYRELREKYGGKTDRLRVESFTRVLSDTVAKIKKSRKCDTVEIRLVGEDEKVRIVARPVQDTKEKAPM